VEVEVAAGLSRRGQVRPWMRRRRRGWACERRGQRRPDRARTLNQEKIATLVVVMIFRVTKHEPIMV
jgi:hypothetical protein